MNAENPLGRSLSPLVHRLEHRRVARLLPWLVNETLDAAGRRRVENHLAGCDDCRRRLERERRLAAFLDKQRLSPVAPHPAKLQTLLQRIDEAPRPRCKDRRRWTLAGGLPAPRAIWLLVGVQAVALLLVGAALFLEHWQDRAGPEAPYRTLSAPSAASSDGGPHLQVVFAPSIPEEEIRALLERLDGRIVDGPTALGVYTIALAPGSGERRVEAALSLLRRQPDVLFAEPLPGGASDR